MKGFRCTSRLQEPVHSFPVMPPYPRITLSKSWDIVNVYFCPLDETMQKDQECLITGQERTIDIMEGQGVAIKKILDLLELK